ncbi:MAG: YheC/YheD family protein [Chloroflexota bacterium]
MPVKVLLLPGGASLSRNAIAMSPGLALQIGAVTNLVHELKFGRGKAEAVLTTRTDLPPTAVRIGTGLRNILHLPLGQRLYLSRPRAGCLRLGPVVGLLTTPSINPPWGVQNDLFRQLIRYGKSLGEYVYAFTPPDVDLQHETVMAWLPLRLGQWRRLVAPLPDVIYDRVPSRKAEASDDLAQLKEKLRPTYGACYFNPSFLNKWDTHQLLQANREVARFLPETHLLNSSTDLEAMLKAHRLAFLKPVDGSIGKGIIRVRRLADGRVSYRLPYGRETVSPDTATALARLSRHMRRHTYLVQQGLRLATSGGAPFDVRVLVQRGVGGRWFRTKVYGRVAPPGTFISNISRGATPANIGTLLHSAFPDAPLKRRAALAGLKEITDTVPRAVETALDATLGELGIDVGIDTSGRAWLIEVNSKPMRTLDPNLGSLEGVRNAIIRPLVYARYLAGFEPAGASAKRRSDNG